MHRRENLLSNFKCYFSSSLINVENFKKRIMLPEVLRDFITNCLKIIIFIDKPIKGK